MMTLEDENRTANTITTILLIFFVRLFIAELMKNTMNSNNFELLTCFTLAISLRDRTRLYFYYRNAFKLLSYDYLYRKLKAMKLQ